MSMLPNFKSLWTIFWLCMYLHPLTRCRRKYRTSGSVSVFRLFNTWTRDWKQEETKYVETFWTGHLYFKANVHMIHIPTRTTTKHHEIPQHFCNGYRAISNQVPLNTQLHTRVAANNMHAYWPTGSIHPFIKTSTHSFTHHICFVFVCSSILSFTRLSMTEPIKRHCNRELYTTTWHTHPFKCANFVGRVVHSICNFIIIKCFIAIKKIQPFPNNANRHTLKPKFGANFVITGGTGVSHDVSTTTAFGYPVQCNDYC